MSPPEKKFELTISEKSGKEILQIKQILGPKNLLLRELREFLSNRFDAATVSFTMLIFRKNTEAEHWIGNYLLKLKEPKLAKDMYAPRKFNREI